MNQWNERYHQADYYYGTQAQRFLQQVLPLLPKNGSVLGLAEGEGRNAVFLAQHGFDVLGVDISEVGLQKAIELAQQNGVAIRTQVADLAEFDMGHAQYDVITAIFAHLPSTLLRSVLARAQMALKPNGCFVGVWYHPDQLQYDTGGPKNRDMLPTLSDIQAAMPHLEWLVAEEKLDYLIEGVGHTGECAVVCCLGRLPHIHQ